MPFARRHKAAARFAAVWACAVAAEGNDAPPRFNRSMKAIVLVILLLALPGLASAADGPAPPCGTPPSPAYPAIGAPPATASWTAGDLDPRWMPAACIGWRDPQFKLLIALAGRLRGPRSADEMLARFGAVSALAGIRYWSVTDGRWQTLIAATAALDGPSLDRRRRDFLPAELKDGKDHFFAQRDNRSSNDVIYRLRVREAGSERLVIELENVTAVRFFLISLFAPGDLRSVYFLERSGADDWGYYSVMRIGPGASASTQDYQKSYINRAVALFRHVAGIPTDQEPPAAR
jgi:hypothetical protein